MLDDLAEPGGSAGGWVLSKEELDAIRAMAAEVIEYREIPSYRSKARRCRPWPKDPVANVTLPGQANKNLPLRAAFPVAPSVKPRFIRNQAARVEMEGPEGSSVTAYRPRTSPALKQVLVRFRGPWKTRSRN